MSEFVDVYVWEVFAKPIPLKDQIDVELLEVSQQYRRISKIGRK